MLFADVVAAVSVSSPQSPIDAPLTIRLKSAPGQTVTVRLETKRYGMTFASTMRIAATTADWFDVPDSMQLFWTVMPTGAPTESVTFRRDSDLETRAYTVAASAAAGTSSTTIERVALGSNVTRTVVDRSTLVGTLFSAADGTCRPGVIVLGGSEGGVPEEISAVLASHGFTTLALAYFNAPNLKDELVDVPIELVQDGVSFMKANRSVCHDRPLGVLGSSKGAELALLSAAYFSDIRAVAAVAPSSVVFSGIGRGVGSQSSWSFHRQPLPFANGTVPQSVKDAIEAQRNARAPISFAAEYASMLENTDPQAIIPVERIAGPVLLVAGGSDRLWPSLEMADRIIARLRAAQHPYNDRLLAYPDAGHPIGLPYQFAAAELAHSAIALGGSPAVNEAASEDAWPKIVQFFRDALK
jgi:dienelactone hydrolase